MDSSEAIKEAMKNLKELEKLVQNLMNKHRRNFEAQLNGISSLLDDLQVQVTGLKTKIENFKFQLSIRELEDFQKTLMGLKIKCETLCDSRMPPPSTNKLSDQLNELDKSLRDQHDILRGQKPNLPKRTGMVGILTRTLSRAGISTPEETTPRWRGWARAAVGVLDRTVNITSEPPKRGAKELYETLSGRVENLMKSTQSKDRIHQNLKCVKSRLDGLKQEQIIQNIEAIEEQTVELHFWINEVEDLKKELSKGLRVCPADLSKVSTPHKIPDELHELDKSLQKQVILLKCKIKQEHNRFAQVLHRHH